MLDEWLNQSLKELQDAANDTLFELSEQLLEMEQLHIHYQNTFDDFETAIIGQKLFDDVDNFEFSYADYQLALVEKSIARAFLAMRHIDVLRDLKTYRFESVNDIDRDITDTLNSALTLKNIANTEFQFLSTDDPIMEEEMLSDIDDNLATVTDLIHGNFAQITTEQKERSVVALRAKADLQDDLGKNLYIYALLSLDHVKARMNAAKSLYNELSINPTSPADLVQSGYPDPTKFMAETIFGVRNQLANVPHFIEKGMQVNRRGGSSGRALPLFSLDAPSF
jgi:hypothetical protein